MDAAAVILAANPPAPDTSGPAFIAMYAVALRGVWMFGNVFVNGEPVFVAFSQEQKCHDTEEAEYGPDRPP